VQQQQEEEEEEEEEVSDECSYFVPWALGRRWAIRCGVVWYGENTSV